MQRKYERFGIDYFPKRIVQVGIPLPILEMIKKDAKRHGVSISEIIRDCVLDRYHKRYLDILEAQIRKEKEAIEREELNPQDK